MCERSLWVSLEAGNVLPVVLYFLLFLYSVVLHEIAHGLVAKWCGDPTAEAQGRLSLNPIVHLDPIMSVLVPIVMFMSMGWAFGAAKPVPVNPFNFRDIVRGTRLVSAAGVTVNLVLGFIFSLALRIPGLNPMLAQVFGLVMVTNVVLFILNLVPVPPLDGSRILRTFLPQRMSAAFDRLDRFGIILLFPLLMLFGKYLMVPVEAILKYVYFFTV